jgi:predicted MFS family arabinose efflux permease
MIAKQQTHQTQQHSTHNRRQAWMIALSGVLALGVALGIGRFAFSPLLPMMLHDKVITLTEGGWLATANYVGYFLGALLCMTLRGNPAHYIRTGLALTVALTLAMGFSSTLGLLIFYRTLAGIASALVFVFTSGWCMQRLNQLGSPTLGGMIYTGPGLGILITGIPVSFMVLANWSAHSGWLAFATMGLIVTGLIWPTFTDKPIRIDNNEPVNQLSKPVQLIAAPLPAAELAHQTRWLVIGYGLAGLGYIITATFLPVMARITLQNSIWPELFWPILGLSIAIGSALTVRVPMHIDNRLMLLLCYLVQALGVICVILMPSVVGFLLSSILVGMPFSAIVFFAMRDARRLRGDAASRLMGLLTAIYGIGQISGPPIATYLVVLTGSFDASLWVAAGALVIGALLFGVMVRQSNAAK